MALDMTADLDFAMKDKGSAVVYGGATYYGFKVITEDVLLFAQEAGLVGRVTGVDMRTGSPSGLSEGDSLTVDGVAHKVISALMHGNGSLTRVLCKRV